jgi:hypothetical protein
MGNTGIDKCRAGSIKESQWIIVVPDFFTSRIDCDIFYCDIGIRSKGEINTGHDVVDIMKGYL